MAQLDSNTLFDYPVAAARLNITERHLKELVYRREIPYIKVGKLVRFDPDDLDAWISANRHPAKTAVPA